jgi:hypothetical protein
LDVLQLVKENKVDGLDGDFKALILKSASRNCMKNSNESAAAKNPATAIDLDGLSFPDWSGMKDHTPMNFDQAYAYNQELIAMFPPKPDEEARRWARKSNVEFVL